MAFHSYHSIWQEEHSLFTFDLAVLFVMIVVCDYNPGFCLQNNFDYEFLYVFRIQYSWGKFSHR